MAIEKLKNVYNDWNEIKKKTNEIIENGGGGGGTTEAVWGRIQGNITNQADLVSALGAKANSNDVYNKTQTNNLLNQKQNLLTAGTGIKIENDTISEDIIKDARTSNDSTWSSQKINQVVSYIINDTLTSGNTTWSSQELADRFAAMAGSARIEVVQQLPQTLVDNILYYVATSTPDVYNIKVQSGGILYDMGTTQIDLSRYYTKSDVDNLLNDYYNKSQVYTQSETDALVAQAGKVKDVQLNGNTVLNAQTGIANMIPEQNINSTTASQNTIPSTEAVYNYVSEKLVGEETTLWSGRISAGTTITLSQPIGNFDYLEFYVGGETGTGAYPSIYRYHVSSMLRSATYGNKKFIIPVTWDASINRFLFINNTITSSTTSLTLVFSNNPDLTLYEIRGIKAALLNSGNAVKIMTYTGAKTDNSGYLKTTELRPFSIQGTIIGLKILNPTTSMLNDGIKQTILQNSTSSNLNLWCVHLASWNGNSYNSITNLNVEIYYV